MKLKPKDLIFVSKILRDGSGTEKVSEAYLRAMVENPFMKNEKFKIHRLSISEDTYLAIGFNSFVVRLKK